MVQLNTTSKSALGKQAQLRNEKFVDLEFLLVINSHKPLTRLTCFFRNQLHCQNLVSAKEEGMQTWVELFGVMVMDYTDLRPNGRS